MKRVYHTLFMISTTFIPFIGHQVVAYLTFCRQEDSSRHPAWCSNKPPFIYTYVQGKYWNVGFLRYWTTSQLPNFFICAPVLALLLWFSTHRIRLVLFPYVLHDTIPHFSGHSDPKAPSVVKPSPLLSLKFAPHALHALLLSLIILFASHTQIILRLAASMPFTYWAAAYLLLEHPTWGKSWVTWSVVWGAISIVLWATFLPPA